MYCTHCGTNLNEDAKFCPNCGAPVEAQNNDFASSSSPSSSPSSQNSAATAPGDAPNFGYALIGFLIPLVGLILYFIWKNDYPLRARSCGKGALVSVLINVFGFVLLVACSALLGFSSSLFGYDGEYLLHLSLLF